MTSLNDRLVALARAVAVGQGVQKRMQLVAFELVKEYDQQTHQEEQNASADPRHWSERGIWELMSAADPRMRAELIRAWTDRDAASEAERSAIRHALEMTYARAGADIANNSRRASLDWQLGYSACMDESFLTLRRRTQAASKPSVADQMGPVSDEPDIPPTPADARRGSINPRSIGAYECPRCGQPYVDHDVNCALTYTADVIAKMDAFAAEQDGEL